MKVYGTSSLESANVSCVSAVRMVAASKADYPSEYEAISSMAGELGVGSPEPVRKWVLRAQIDQGARSGKTNAEIGNLKKQVAELRWANDIIKRRCCFSRGGARPPIPVLDGME